MKYKLLFTLIFVSIGTTALSQFEVPGDIKSPFEFFNPKLVSLEIDGVIYAPRHGNLPIDKYQFKVVDSGYNFSHTQILRPVEIFVSNDKGNTVEQGSLPLYLSYYFSGPSIGTDRAMQMIPLIEYSIMKRISPTHFVLSTVAETFDSRVTQTTYFSESVIYVFEIDKRPNYLPVKIVHSYSFGSAQDKIIDIKTVGETTTFLKKSGGNVKFTFNAPGLKWGRYDSNGPFMESHK